MSSEHLTWTSSRPATSVAMRRAGSIAARRARRRPRHTVRGVCSIAGPFTKAMRTASRLQRARTHPPIFGIFEVWPRSVRFFRHMNRGAFCPQGPML